MQCIYTLFIDMENRIEQIKSELHRLYKVFYSKNVPPLVQRRAGCRIIALKDELKKIFKENERRTTSF